MDCPAPKNRSGRRWRYYSSVGGKLAAISERGFQADFAKNQDSLARAIGREMTTIVEMMEYIYPDIDVHFGSTWD
jgi:hypothetical protein